MADIAKNAKLLPREHEDRSNWTLSLDLLHDLAQEVKENGWDRPDIKVIEIIALGVERRVCAVFDALRAERDKALAERDKAILAKCEAEAVEMQHGAFVERVMAERDKALAERDKAIKALVEEAMKRGESEGKLAASEMAGVLEGWIERCKKAEAERDEAMKALLGEESTKIKTTR